MYGREWRVGADDEVDVHFPDALLLPKSVPRLFEGWLSTGPLVQKDLRSIGRRIGTLTAMIPATVSRTPQRLIFNALG